MLKTKEEIKSWLNKHMIGNYTINEDLTVDVAGNVNIAFKNLTDIPVQFNNVDGEFDCSNNKLTSLKGCPVKLGSSFFCYTNKLESLKYVPKHILGNFNCKDNKITDLNDGPMFVDGSFNCGNNQLKSLVGAPKKVKSFICNNNELTDLNGCPEEITGLLDFMCNKVESLFYFPKKVFGPIYVNSNKVFGKVNYSMYFDELNKQHKIEFKQTTITNHKADLDKMLTNKNDNNKQIKI